MFNHKTRKLAMDSMLAAMCAVLGYLSLDFGSLKITFESVPILLGALLLGPIDGMAIGGVGTLLYQLVRYGVSITTPLWILPYVLCGLVVGLGSARRGLRPSCWESTVFIVSGELLITLLNTVTLYIDSRIYGYYTTIPASFWPLWPCGWPSAWARLRYSPCCCPSWRAPWAGWSPPRRAPEFSSISSPLYDTKDRRTFVRRSFVSACQTSPFLL